MGHQDGVKVVSHKKVSVLRIGLIHGYYLIHCYYHLLFVIFVLSFNNLDNLLLYLCLMVMHCISAEIFYTWQTAGVKIEKRLPN